MRSLNNPKLGIMALLIGLLLSSPLYACQVPVFRYALERWEAGVFKATVIHNKKLPDPLALSLAQLKKKSKNSSSINLELKQLNLSTMTRADRWSVDGIDTLQSFPSFLLKAPQAMKIKTPIAKGSLTTEIIEQLETSPARHQIAQRILDGDSAVFVLVCKKDNPQLQQAKQQLRTALDYAQQHIKLPDGILRPEDVTQQAQEKGEIELEDVLRSSIPLQIKFSILHLDPDDPAEQLFIRLLRAPMPPDSPQEYISPIFGRGRALPPLPLLASSELVQEKCKYLCGTCTCSVKDQNPGYDILMSAPWAASLSDSLLVVEKPLSDLSVFGANSGASEEIETKKPRESNILDKTVSPPAPAQSISTGVIWYWTIGIFLLLGISSLVIFKKKSV